MFSFIPTTICAIPVFPLRTPVLNWLDLGGYQIVRRTESGWLVGREDPLTCAPGWNAVELSQGKVCATNSGVPGVSPLPLVPVLP